MPGSTLALILTFVQDPPAAWPASAGPAPAPVDAKYGDPEPDWMDPPPGIYRLPDGTYRHLDPPRGFYDPPPGYYSNWSLRDTTHTPSLGPLPVPVDPADRWRARQRRLHIGVGVSVGFLFAGVLGTILFFVLPARGDRAPDDAPGHDGWPIGLMVCGLGVIPISSGFTLGYSVALGLHDRDVPPQLRRPSRRRVRFAPGGLLLHF